jgi:hypothetical protein
MCDYSLMSFPNRLAKEGEQLVVHRFPCGAIGLASPVGVLASQQSSALRLRRVWSAFRGTAPQLMAVCIPHGARLIVLDIPEHLQRELDVERTEEAMFRQINATPFQYRDAICFRNGRQILLQRLVEGQRVRVVDLSVGNLTGQLADLNDDLPQWHPGTELPAAAKVCLEAMGHAPSVG